MKLREFAGIDFAAALDIWEYKLIKDINAFGDIDVFAILESISETKLCSAMLSNPVCH